MEKLTSAFKPCECKSFSVSTQKYSCFFNRSVAKSLSIFILSSCSFKVNLACWLKLWLVSLKCWFACDVFCLLTFLQWLFNLMLNSVSDFPTYWIRQILHSRRYINSFHLQLKSWEIWYVFCVTLILENWVCRTCLPHKFLNLEKHMVENSIFFFLESLGSFSSTIFLHPVGQRGFCSFLMQRYVVLETHL